MKLLCQLKEVKKHISASNDAIFTVKLVTESVPVALFSIPSDSLVTVEIEEE